MGISREYILDFLAIIAEEMETTDLLPPNMFVSPHASSQPHSSSWPLNSLINRAQMEATLADAVPLVPQAIRDYTQTPYMSVLRTSSMLP